MSNRRGTTLIEVLIAMGITVMLLTAILGFAVSGLRLWHLGADKVDVDESALVAIKALNGYLRASDVNSVYLNPSGVTAGVSFLSGVKNGQLDYVVSTPRPRPPAASTPPPASTPSSSPPPSSPGGCTACGCDCAPGPCPGGTPRPVVPGSPAPAATAPDYADDGRVVWQAWQVIYYDATRHALRLGTVSLPKPGVSPSPYRLDHYTPAPDDHLLAVNIDQMSVSDAPLDLAGHVPNPTPTANPIYVSVTAVKATVSQPAMMLSAIYLDNGLETGGDTGEAACP